MNHPQSEHREHKPWVPLTLCHQSTGRAAWLEVHHCFNSWKFYPDVGSEQLHLLAFS